MRTQTGRGAELRGKMHAREACGARHVLETDRFGEVRVDILDRPLQAAI